MKKKFAVMSRTSRTTDYGPLLLMEEHLHELVCRNPTLNGVINCLPISSINHHIPVQHILPSIDIGTYSRDGFKDEVDFTAKKQEILTLSHLKMDGWNLIVSFWDGLFPGVGELSVSGSVFVGAFLFTVNDMLLHSQLFFSFCRSWPR